MKIRTQVNISLIIFVILAGVILFSVIFSTNHLYEIQKKQQIIDNIEKSSFELYYLENDYLVYGGTIPVERWNSKYAALTGQLQELTLTESSQQAEINEMSGNLKELNTSFSNLVAITGGVRGTEPLDANQELKEFYSSTLAGQTQTLMSSSSKLSQLVKAEASMVEQRNALVISFSLAVLIVFVLLNYLIINRSVLRSISTLHKGTERIGSGDLETNIETGTSDELGDLSVAFNEMSSSLKNTQTLLLTSNAELKQENAERRQAEEELWESEEHYRELADSITDIFFAMDKDLRYTYWNKASEKLTGIAAQDAIGKTIYEIFSDTPDTLRAVEVYEDVIRTHQPRSFENEHYLGGQHLFFEISAYPSAGGIAVFTKEITGRKREEESLFKINEKLLHLGRDYNENIGALTSLCGELLNADCVLYNRLHEGLLCTFGQWNAPPDLKTSDAPAGHICFDVINGDGGGPLVVRNLSTSRYAQTDPNVAAYGLQTYIGHPVTYGGITRGSLCAVYTRDIEPTPNDLRIIGIISTAVAQEEERREAEEVLKSLVLETTGVRGQAFFDKAVRWLCQYTRADIALISELVQENRARNIAMVADGKTVNEYEYSLEGTPCEDTSHKGFCHFPRDIAAIFPTDADLVTFNVSGYAGIPMHDKDGRVVGIICVLSHRELILPPLTSTIMDLLSLRASAELERWRYEEQLKHFNEELEKGIADRTERLNDSLEEKVVLLREIHHRVKNNLQIILSLISLQSRNIKDPHLLDTMGDFQNRIMAMAHVHERMCRAEDISRIDLSEIVTFLGTSLFRSYKVDRRHIRLNVEMKDLQVTIDSAIPISLIINELISNSIKHGFPKGTTGEITIAGRREADTLVFSIRDTGTGIPQDLDWMRSKQSLGHRLVISLVEQLSGTIELDRTAGTTFNIVVKEKQ